MVNQQINRQEYKEKMVIINAKMKGHNTKLKDQKDAQVLTKNESTEP